MSSNIPAHLSHGEMKRRIAWRVGTDPDRYGDDIGTERHKRLTSEEIGRLADEFGLGFLEGETRQQKIDSLMLKLGRDHRTGTRSLDSSDLRAILEALQ